MLSAIYPGRDPRDVIREHGLGELELDLNDDYGDLENDLPGEDGTYFVSNTKHIFCL